MGLLCVQACIDTKYTLYLSVPSGEATEQEVLASFLSTFGHVTGTGAGSSRGEPEVTWDEFELYYEGLSLGVESDEDFANILKNSWSI